MNEFIVIISWISLFITLFFTIYWFLYFFENKTRIKDESDEKIVIKNYPMFSVIVPIWNEGKTVQRTLKSVISADYPKDKLELLIINDGSTDNSKKIVQNFIKKNKGYNIRLINHEKNKGKGVALNTGLKHLKGELFACLDADSFIDKDIIKRMVFWHQKQKDVVIFTPIMKVYKPKTFIQKFQRLEYMTAMLVAKLMSYMDCNYVAPGPFSVYKTEIIRKLGGFDEKNLVEDQEIAYKAQEKHYKIRQCPHSYVYTIGPSTMKGFGNQRNRWYKGTLLNLIKYRKLIFNRKYGDFGVFQLPLNIIAYVLAAITLTIFSYYLIKPIIEQMRNLYLINFDIIPYLKTFTFNFDIFGYQVHIFFIIYLMLFTTLIFLYFASRTNKDRVRAYGVFYIIPYFFLYFIIISFIMVKVSFEVIFKRKQQRW